MKVPIMFRNKQTITVGLFLPRSIFDSMSVQAIKPKKASESLDSFE